MNNANLLCKHVLPYSYLPIIKSKNIVLEDILELSSKEIREKYILKDTQATKIFNAIYTTYQQSIILGILTAISFAISFYFFSMA